MSTDHVLSKKQMWEFASSLAVGDEVTAKIKVRDSSKTWVGVVRTLPSRKSGPQAYAGILWTHNAVDELAFPEDGNNGTVLRAYLSLSKVAAVVDPEEDSTPLRKLRGAQPITPKPQPPSTTTNTRHDPEDDEEEEEEEEEEDYAYLNPRNEAVYMDPVMWAKVFANDPDRNADRIIDALHHRFGSVGAMTPEKHILDDVLRALEHLVRMASRATPLCKEDEFVSACKFLLGRLYLQSQKKAGMRATNLQALHEELTNLHPAKWVTAATKRASAKLKVGLVLGDDAQKPRHKKPKGDKSGQK
jgi:hypothetical protein